MGKISNDIGEIKKSAVVSRCGLYRYELRRVWDEDRPLVVWVGLNPSSADARNDDPTNRRIAGFSRSWDFGGYILVNLFALRAIDPAALKRAVDPVGPRNTVYLKRACKSADAIICAWGNSGRFMDRARQVLPLIERPFALEVTKVGEPKHPLYCRASLMPRDYRPG